MIHPMKAPSLVLALTEAAHATDTHPLALPAHKKDGHVGSYLYFSAPDELSCLSIHRVDCMHEITGRLAPHLTNPEESEIAMRAYDPHMRETVAQSFVTRIFHNARKLCGTTHARVAWPHPTRAHLGLITTTPANPKNTTWEEVTPFLTTDYTPFLSRLLPSGDDILNDIRELTSPHA